jgi:hypothetical protein
VLGTKKELAAVAGAGLGYRRFVIGQAAPGGAGHKTEWVIVDL